VGLSNENIFAARSTSVAAESISHELLENEGIHIAINNKITGDKVFSEVRDKFSLVDKRDTWDNNFLNRNT
jgi:hypothetical protein